MNSVTRLTAIKHLQDSFKNNPKFKKAWTDYIELSIIEELENNKINLPTEKELKFVKDSSAHIVRLLFDADWWSAQGLK